MALETFGGRASPTGGNLGSPSIEFTDINLKLEVATRDIRARTCLHPSVDVSVSLEHGESFAISNIALCAATCRVSPPAWHSLSPRSCGQLRFITTPQHLLTHATHHTILDRRRGRTRGPDVLHASRVSCPSSHNCAAFNGIDAGPELRSLSAQYYTCYIPTATYQTATSRTSSDSAATRHLESATRTAIMAFLSAVPRR